VAASSWMTTNITTAIPGSSCKPTGRFLSEAFEILRWRQAAKVNADTGIANRSRPCYYSANLISRRSGRGRTEVVSRPSDP